MSDETVELTELEGRVELVEVDGVLEVVELLGAQGIPGPPADLGAVQAAIDAGDAATLAAAQTYADDGLLAEATARQGGDTTEATARLAGDAATLASAQGYADGAVAAEATARADADASEATARAAADAAEASARAAADALLVPLTRQLATTLPLTGGGDLSANRTLAINPATASAAGSMSAADKAALDGTTGLLTVYVETTGNDANDGLSLGTAVQTLPRAIDVAGARGRGQIRIAMGLGTFTGPTAGTPLTFVNGRGGACIPEIYGTWVDSGLGTLTIASVVAGNLAGMVLAQVVVTGAAWTTNQWQGYRFRITSGASSGALKGIYGIVAANTANTLWVEFGSTTAAGSIGNTADTFVLESRGTHITFSGTCATVGGAATLHGIDLQGGTSADLLTVMNILQLDCCSFTRTGGSSPTVQVFGGLTSGASVFGLRFRANTDGVTPDIQGTGFDAGIYAKGVNITFLAGSRGLLRGGVYQDSRLLAQLNAIYSDTAGVRYGDSGVAVAGAHGGVQNLRFETVTPRPSGLSAAVAFYDGARGTIASCCFNGTPATNADLSGVTRGDAIGLDRCPEVTITGNIGDGAANAGAGLRVRSNCAVRVDTTNTVTGTADGNVRFMDPAGNYSKTWALVQVNTTPADNNCANLMSRVAPA